MTRQARLDAPGTLHHVVIRGIERGRIVQDDQDRKSFVSPLGNLAQNTETSIYARSPMTNHANMLLQSGTNVKKKEGRSYIRPLPPPPEEPLPPPPPENPRLPKPPLWNPELPLLEGELKDLAVPIPG